MKKHNSTSDSSFAGNGSKDNRFTTQFRQTFEGFYSEPLTMKELSVYLGIDRANICRYCREMRKAGTIAVVKKTYCSITKHIANKYTTNPDLFPIDSQLKLF
jgi:DNA-binding transcriptional regulator LsrR (DeoR family)